MFKVHNIIRLKEIIVSLKNDIINCVYMYIDLSRFGLDNVNINLYEDSNTILMKYFNSLTTYKVSKYNSEQIARFLANSNISIVTGLSEDCSLLKKKN